MVSYATPIGREVAAGRARRGNAASRANVGELERWASLVGGGLLALTGLRQGSLGGLGMSAVGGALVYRGLTGRCEVYGALGVDTAKPHGQVASIPAGQGVKVVRAITIARPAEELYRIWRNFDGLPRFMQHLVSVKSEGNRSHWVARAPMGASISWDAEIVNEEPNRLIAWRSVEGSRVATAGSVTFEPAPGGRGTEVHVTLKYDPPGGKLGSWLAWAFGEEPGVQVGEDLRRLKQMMEAGEIATVEGQPSCR